MPHALTELKLAEVTQSAQAPAHRIRADVCVVGAGIAGLSAAIESARLHRDVVLVDSLPLLGGQMVHSLIGLFCGVFGNAPAYRQLTHGILDDIFRDLGPAGDLHFQPGHTKTVYYNEVALGRWLERAVRGLGVKTVLGTVLQRADLDDGRITQIELASRYGNVTVEAAGFIDASGDAALTWQAGLPCWVPERPIYGSQQVIVENVDESHQPDWGEIDAMLAARGGEHGLLRRGGLAFFFPGRGTAVLNVTHIEAPLDPVDASPDHVHYVPLRSMTPPGAGNLVAAGRCVDGDAGGLSSVRVMGPCAAMGAAAAHALDLSAREQGSVHDVDLSRLRERLAANLD
jgi:flavin-dependent dehydrogenase